MSIDEKILKKLETLTEAEQQQLLKTLETPNRDVQKYSHNFGGKHIRIASINDTHIGVKQFDEELLLKLFKFYKKNHVDAIYHGGDILEGMSGRPGHIYELSHIGYTAQMDYCEQLFNQTTIPIFGITGNHDDWYMGKNNGGVDVGVELEKRVKHFHNLGHNEADIIFNDKFKMKLIHPNDGSAYAPGYKLMKFIESLGGGEKPHILIEAHYHKAMYMFSRNIHAYDGGTLCGQTSFMRGKKLAAHKGGWMMDYYFSNDSIERVVNTFLPKYD